eukprot:5523851-Prymnesium_polylepis.1
MCVTAPAVRTTCPPSPIQGRGARVLCYGALWWRGHLRVARASERCCARSRTATRERGSCRISFGFAQKCECGAVVGRSPARRVARPARPERGGCYAMCRRG